MANRRPTTRELAEAKKQERLAEMEVAISNGTLTVRQMTPRERKKAQADRDAAVSKRAARTGARSSRR